MKNFILHRISSLQTSILYVMLFTVFALLSFITLIYQHKSADHDNTITALSGGIVGFMIIFGLLYRLNKDIRLRNNAKDDLAANEIKYKNLIKNAGVVMYTTSLKGLITFASSRATQLTEYSLDELTGRSFMEFVDAECLEEVKQKYKEQFKNNIDESLLEFCIRTKYGDLKWVEQSAVLIKENGLPSGFQCVIKDISQRKEMEAKLVTTYKELQHSLNEQALSHKKTVESEVRFRQIVETAQEGIWMLDANNKTIFVNKKMCEILEYTEEEMMGRTNLSFKDPEEQIKALEQIERRKQGITEAHDSNFVTKSGRHIVTHVSTNPILDKNGNYAGALGMMTEITEKVKYQERLIQATKIAEDAKKLQEQFLANMSHEIRTPMNGIQGMTDLLLETELNVEQKDFAKTIKRSSDNLLVIINDILDFSKIKAGKLTIEKIDFTLNEVIENIKAVFKHRINEKKLSFQVNVDDNVPSLFNGDPYRLNQILINLVGNAIKFTHTGGIVIDISSHKKSANEIMLNLTISDTGIGIQPDKINDIFDSFTQGSVETSRKYGGTGLGLAITKQLLELQKGKISIESEINRGTTFKVCIPYNYSNSDSPAFFKGRDLKNYRTLLNGKKFLVAEDNEVNQKVIRHVLQKAGGTVDIANNGLEAINFLKGNTYNLIIMDLQMPEMDGYAATKYIRNIMNLSTPIIAMTASALKGEKSKCLEMGMNDYLSKPFDFAFIYQRISLLLGEIPVNDSLPVVQTSENKSLFDLGLLEEMDDNEYISDVLTIFLKNTPADLTTLQTACISEDFEDAFKIAHKLKSSTGLLKANDLLSVLIKIEEGAKAGSRGILTGLSAHANNEYKKIETPLQQHLDTIQTGSRIAV